MESDFKMAGQDERRQVPEALRERLRRAPMTFRAFMEWALYAPEQGYYARGQEPGRGGDYFTSVSVGSCFAELLAEYVHERWRDLGAPREFTVLEQGGNTGTLAADLLQAISAKFTALREALAFVAVETSPCAMSDARLGGLGGWTLRAGLGEVAPGSVDLALSNELLDAFPMHRVCWKGPAEGWREDYVEEDGDGPGLVCRLGPLSEKALEEALAWVTTEALMAGYTTEVNLEYGPWCTATRDLIKPGGRVLVIDYGLSEEAYYSPSRRDGTLQAYHRHRPVGDVLARPGCQDLTAHVNFTRLAEAAEAAGLAVIRLQEQQRFLTALAREPLLAMEASLAGRAPDAEAAKWLRQFQQLTSLGPNFKVMELGNLAGGA